MGQWVESAGLGAIETGSDDPERDRHRRAVDLAYQARILPAVSRTFALTIPQLPPRLSEVVSNAYLLCRIADTVEDDPGLTVEDKLRFSRGFAEVVAGGAAADAFAEALAGVVGPAVPAAERDLIEHVPAVIRLTHGCSPAQRAALARCVRVMSDGMAEFQLNASTAGLPDLAHLDRYCYHVAGVVGEMLTTLFCEHSPAIAAHRDRLMTLSVSFGQGLQMTNILKDLWDDLERGACWLPRAHFARYGYAIEGLGRDGGGPGFERGLLALVAVAHRHLEDALAYTLLIPSCEHGIRRFCLWALGMAVLTLRKIRANPGFRASDEVKISRTSVRATVLATSALVASDTALRALFRAAGRGLGAVAPE